MANKVREDGLVTFRMTQEEGELLQTLADQMQTSRTQLLRLVVRQLDFEDVLEYIQRDAEDKRKQGGD